MVSGSKRARDNENEDANEGGLIYAIRRYMYNVTNMIFPPQQQSESSRSSAVEEQVSRPLKRQRFDSSDVATEDQKQEIQQNVLNNGLGGSVHESLSEFSRTEETSSTRKRKATDTLAQPESLSYSTASSSVKSPLAGDFLSFSSPSSTKNTPRSGRRRSAFTRPCKVARVVTPKPVRLDAFGAPMMDQEQEEDQVSENGPGVKGQGESGSKLEKKGSIAGERKESQVPVAAAVAPGAPCPTCGTVTPVSSPSSSSSSFPPLENTSKSSSAGGMAFSFGGGDNQKVKEVKAKNKKSEPVKASVVVLSTSNEKNKQSSASDKGEKKLTFRKDDKSSTPKEGEKNEEQKKKESPVSFLKTTSTPPIAASGAPSFSSASSPSPKLPSFGFDATPKSKSARSDAADATTTDNAVGSSKKFTFGAPSNASSVGNESASSAVSGEEEEPKKAKSTTTTTTSSGTPFVFGMAKDEVKSSNSSGSTVTEGSNDGNVAENGEKKKRKKFVFTPSTNAPPSAEKPTEVKKAPAFQFGAPTSSSVPSPGTGKDKEEEPASSSKSVFQFGAPSKTAAAEKTATDASKPAPVFQFGKSSDAGGGGGNENSVGNSSEAGAASAPVFQFGAASSGSAPAPAAETQVATPSSNNAVFQFGSSSNSSAAPPTSPAPVATPPAAAGGAAFQFGAPGATPMPTFGGAGSGSQAAAAAMPTFGGMTTPAPVSSTPSFGQGAPSFGASSQQSTPAAFSFGGGNVVAPQINFMGSTSSKSGGGRKFAKARRRKRA